MGEVFVVDAAVDEVQVGERHVFQLVHHGADAGFVVGGFADGQGCGADGLPTAVQVGVVYNTGNAPLQFWILNSEFGVAAQHVDSFENGGDVFLLVFEKN